MSRPSALFCSALLSPIISPLSESCVPSASCCCAIGHLNIAPVYEWTAIPALPAGMGGSAVPAAANRSDQVILSANLDGGSTCVGMQNVSQAFSLIGPTAASFSMPPVTLNASLAQSQPGAGLDALTFSNSLYPGCLSRAVKKSNIKNDSATAHSETEYENGAQRGRERRLTQADRAVAAQSVTSLFFVCA